MPTEAPIAHFEFAAGPQRGSRLSLYPARLLHEGAGHMESMPLDALAAVGAVYAIFVVTIARFNRRFVTIVSRVLGLFLTAVGIQMIAAGVQALLATRPA